MTISHVVWIGVAFTNERTSEQTTKCIAIEFARIFKGCENISNDVSSCNPRSLLVNHFTFSWTIFCIPHLRTIFALNWRSYCSVARIINSALYSFEWKRAKKIKQMEMNSTLQMNGSRHKYRRCIQPATDSCEFVNFTFRLVQKQHYDFSK